MTENLIRVSLGACIERIRICRMVLMVAFATAHMPYRQICCKISSAIQPITTQKPQAFEKSRRNDSSMNGLAICGGYRGYPGTYAGRKTRQPCILENCITKGATARAICAIHETIEAAYTKPSKRPTRNHRSGIHANVNGIVLNLIKSTCMQSEPICHADPQIREKASEWKPLIDHTPINRPTLLIAL